MNEIPVHRHLRRLSLLSAFYPSVLQRGNDIPIGQALQPLVHGVDQSTIPRSTLAGDITYCYHLPMKTRHRKTLAAIFAHPTSASIVFADIEALINALGGSVSEREGSRVRIELNGEVWRCHRPHPGKEAKRYQVEEVRELLEHAGVDP